MNNVVKISCYIEEYHDNGKLCVRLREKKSNKKVVLSGANLSKSHFLRFLSQAKIHKDIMPSVFDRNGTDIVSVRGFIVYDRDDEICIDVNTMMGGYLFE